MDDAASVKRRLAAILAADIAGYSRLMGEDEAATVRDLKAHQAVVLPLVGRHGGRIIDTAGDGILAEFPSVIGAAECAIEIQTLMAARNADVSEPRRMQFRIGINLGDVIHDETRIYGDGINVAARLEGIAEPGGICISRQVFEQVNRAVKAGTVDRSPSAQLDSDSARRRTISANRSTGSRPARAVTTRSMSSATYSWMMTLRNPGRRSSSRTRSDGKRASRTRLRTACV